MYGADLERFGHFLPALIAVTHSLILLLLFLDCTLLAIVFTRHLICNTKLAFTDLFDNVKVSVKAIALRHRMRHNHFCGGIKEQAIRAWPNLDLW